MHYVPEKQSRARFGHKWAWHVPDGPKPGTGQQQARTEPGQTIPNAAPVPCIIQASMFLHQLFRTYDAETPNQTANQIFSDLPLYNIAKIVYNNIVYHDFGGIPNGTQIQARTLEGQRRSPRR